MILVTIDPQPSLTAMCVYTHPNNYQFVKLPLIPDCSHLKMDRNEKCRHWLNHSPHRIRQHLDTLSEYIPDNVSKIYIEGQFKGKAMIGLDYFMRGYFSLKFPCARVHTLSARTWKSILGQAVKKGKSYYEEELWSELENPQVTDLCTGDLVDRNHDLVDVYGMMKYVNKV